ncbi:MAG: GNAT family N-acetyltransferase, partial [Acidimicrobiales bacterium]
LSTDPADVDVDVVATFLHDEAYWSLGRPRAVVERSLAASRLYSLVAEDGAMAAFARVVTDGVTFGWICDLFVVAAHRGQGLGHQLVEAIVADPDLAGMKRLLLATADAHGVYADVGFIPLLDPTLWMERPGPGA